MLPEFGRICVRRLSTGTAVLAVGAAALLCAPVEAHAASLPFHDPNAVGLIGFCNAHNQPITTGRLSDKPFVSRAVSSVAAPRGYTPKFGGKATLFAFQPIKYVDPGDWSNQEMTGSSSYTNPVHPMVAGTVLDYSMGDMVSVLPSHWDGLIQLRILWGAPNKPTLTTNYAAGVIKISHGRWTQVSGYRPNCAAGKAVSFEQQVLPPSRFASASAAIAKSSAAAAPPGSGTRSAAHRTTAGGSAGSSPGTSSGGQDTPARSTGATPGSIPSESSVASAEHGSSSSALEVGVLIAAIVLVALVVAMIARRRMLPPRGN